MCVSLCLGWFALSVAFVSAVVIEVLVCVWGDTRPVCTHSPSHPFCLLSGAVDGSPDRPAQRPDSLHASFSSMEVGFFGCLFFLLLRLTTAHPDNKVLSVMLLLVVTILRSWCCGILFVLFPARVLLPPSPLKQTCCYWTSIGWTPRTQMCKNQVPCMSGVCAFCFCACACVVRASWLGV